MRSEVETLAAGVAEVHQFLLTDDKAVLAAILFLCLSSVLIPILRGVAIVTYRVGRAFFRRVWNIIVDKIVEITIIAALMWFAGASELATVLYFVVSTILRI